MEKEVISTGSAANDGTGDTLRTAGTKINSNFTELYDMRTRVTESKSIALGGSDSDRLKFPNVGNSFILHTIKSDQNAYIKIYTDSDSRVADFGRGQLAAPAPPGLIHEVVATANVPERITPGILGYTDSSNATGIQVQVKNLTGGAATINVELKALKIEI